MIKISIIGFIIILGMAIFWLALGIVGGIGVYIFIGIIFLIIAIILGKIANRKKSNPALDVLKERYAKGEITKDDFDTKKADLE